MGTDTGETRGLARGVVGSARTIAFGTSIVSPSASAATVLVLLVTYAGFASPLVVLITFAGSVCCALSIGQFAGRVPSAGWSYTYNSRGLSPTAGFLTGWMMIFAYALFVPAGIGLTSAFGSLLLASTLHVTVDGWVLFIITLAVAVLVAYLGITTSASADLVLVAAEMAVIAALAITILVKIGSARYSAAVLSPASSPNHRLTDQVHRGDDLRVYRLRRFRGGGRPRRGGERQPPLRAGDAIAAVNAAIRIMFTMGRDQVLPGSLGRLSRRRTPVVAIGALAVITLLIGLPLTYVHGGVPTFGYLAGVGGLPVVLIYLTVNIAVIRAFRTEFRDEFRLGRHLLIPAAATVVFLFPLWGILFPGAYTLMNLLPFIAFGWLLIGAGIAGLLRARRPAVFQALGRRAAPDEASQPQMS